MIVTDKDMRDWYDDYSVQARQAGQALPAYSKLAEKIKDEKIKPNVQAEKFIKDLTAATKVDKKSDVIDKYLASLSDQREDARFLDDASPLDKGAGTAKDDSKP